MKTNFFISLLLLFLVSFTNTSFSKTQVTPYLVPVMGKYVESNESDKDNNKVKCLREPKDVVCFYKVVIVINNPDIHSELINKSFFFPDKLIGSLSVEEGSSGAFYDENGSLVTQRDVKYLQPLEPYRSFTDFMDACIKYSKKLVE